MKEFIKGLLTGILLGLIIWTLRINLNPDHKPNQKIRIYIDNKQCSVEEIQ